MRWIGIDPSLSALGWAVMNREVGGQPTVLATGTIRTKADARSKKKRDDRARRFLEIIDALRLVFEEWAPNEAYVESSARVGKTGYASVTASARARGIVDCMCRLKGVALAEVDAQVAKQAVTGRRDADKALVANTLALHYRLGPVHNRDLNETDALAVAHVGAFRYGGGAEVTSGVVSFRKKDEPDFLYD